MHGCNAWAGADHAVPMYWGRGPRQDVRVSCAGVATRGRLYWARAPEGEEDGPVQGSGRIATQCERSRSSSAMKLFLLSDCDDPGAVCAEAQGAVLGDFQKSGVEEGNGCGAVKRHRDEVTAREWTTGVSCVSCAPAAHPFMRTRRNNAAIPHMQPSQPSH